MASTGTPSETSVSSPPTTSFALEGTASATTFVKVPKSVTNLISFFNSTVY